MQHTDHLTLLELNRQVKQALSSQLLPSYWVIAEIGELRVAQNGHCYLDLVEKSDDRLCAKMRATIWAYTYRGISSWFETLTGERLRAGIKVLAQVEVQFHELYGLSLNIKDIDAQYTVGERARRRQEVIQQLISDGVYEMNKGLSLPLVPQRIAVISSPTAAGLGDFMDQLTGNRYRYRFDVQLFKAAMQGEAAEASMLSALYKIYQQMEAQPLAFDVVVIIRGGGAQVDLDCFDGYDLATHLAQFPLPVITGIGHERDETVADLVAHTKMKTPTAVAEFLISGAYAFESKVAELQLRIAQATQHRLRESTYQLESHQAQLKYSISTQWQQHQHQLAQHQERLKAYTRQQLRDQHQQLTAMSDDLREKTQYYLTLQQQRLNACHKLLTVVHPENVMKRGYTITYVDGKPLQRNTKVPVGSRLVTKTVDTSYISTVNSIEKK